MTFTSLVSLGDDPATVLSIYFYGKEEVTRVFDNRTYIFTNREYSAYTKYDLLQYNVTYQ